MICGRQGTKTVVNTTVKEIAVLVQIFQRGLFKERTGIIVDGPVPAGVVRVLAVAFAVVLELLDSHVIRNSKGRGINAVNTEIFVWFRIVVFRVLFGSAGIGQQMPVIAVGIDRRAAGGRAVTAARPVFKFIGTAVNAHIGPAFSHVEHDRLAIIAHTVAVVVDSQEHCDRVGVAINLIGEIPAFLITGGRITFIAVINTAAYVRVTIAECNQVKFTSRIEFSVDIVRESHVRRIRALLGIGLVQPGNVNTGGQHRMFRVIEQEVAERIDERTQNVEHERTVKRRSALFRVLHLVVRHVDFVRSQVVFIGGDTAIHKWIVHVIEFVGAVGKIVRGNLKDLIHRAESASHHVPDKVTDVAVVNVAAQGANAIKHIRIVRSDGQGGCAHRDAADRSEREIAVNHLCNIGVNGVANNVSYIRVNCYVGCINNVGTDRHVFGRNVNSDVIDVGVNQDIVFDNVSAAGRKGQHGKHE